MGVIAGGTFPNVRVSTSALNVVQGVNADTALATTLIGRRFTYEYKIMIPTLSNSLAGGLGWSGTGTAVGGVCEIEYSIATYGLSRTHTNNVTVQMGTANPFYLNPASSPQPGMFLTRGVMEFDVTANMTLTPQVWLQQASAINIFNRTFRVDVIG